MTLVKLISTFCKGRLKCDGLNRLPVACASKEPTLPYQRLKTGNSRTKNLIIEVPDGECSSVSPFQVDFFKAKI